MKVENYTDERGNTFTPGETVIVCTINSHQSRWTEAVFEGVNYRNEYNYFSKTSTLTPHVVVSKPSKRYVRNIVDGKYKGEFVPCRRKVNLNYNQIYKLNESINILVR